MKSLKEVVDLIEKKGYLFKVAVPGQVYGKMKTVSEARSTCGSLAEFFRDFMEANNGDGLNIATYSQGGACKHCYMLSAEAVNIPVANFVTDAISDIAPVATNKIAPPNLQETIKHETENTLYNETKNNAGNAIK